jgi:hypothetical protein
MKNIQLLIDLLEEMKEREGTIEKLEITYGTRPLFESDKGYDPDFSQETSDGTFYVEIFGYTKSG